MRHSRSARGGLVHRSSYKPSAPFTPPAPRRLHDNSCNGDSPNRILEGCILTAPQIFSFFEYVATCICAAHGWGHLSPYVSQKNRTIVFKSLFVVQLLWILATALVRVSVACSLLRLGQCVGDAEWLWKWCLRIIMGLQFLASTGWFIFLVFNCHPLRGMWEPVPTLSCWAHKYTTMYGWVANRKSKVPWRRLALHRPLTATSNYYLD
jgi:hypothetical protein